MEKNLLGSYRNGNYTVHMYDDGTKVRSTQDAMFRPEFPESIDLKITNRCDMGCPFCHEDSKVDGAHADILNLPFLDTLRPYTEVAIGGGNPLEHPDLSRFLVALKQRNIIANITVNQKHFLESELQLHKLQEKGLIHGIGVSLAGDYNAVHLANHISDFKNIVLHCIVGIVDPKVFWKFDSAGASVLFLGYKHFGRGKFYDLDYITLEINDLTNRTRNLLPDLVAYGVFKSVCFDNLAVKQLRVREMMSENGWKRFYMGDDGAFTMYVDAVSKNYAVSSTSTDRFPVTKDIVEMFRNVRALSAVQP